MEICDPVSKHGVYILENDGFIRDEPFVVRNVNHVLRCHCTPKGAFNKESNAGTGLSETVTD